VSFLEEHEKLQKKTGKGEKRRIARPEKAHENKGPERIAWKKRGHKEGTESTREKGAKGGVGKRKMKDPAAGH